MSTSCKLISSKQRTLWRHDGRRTPIMLKWGKAKHEKHQVESLMARPELQIRNLLDDPALRRAMGLDQSSLTAVMAPATAKAARTPRPGRRFDRRTLLETLAA